MRNRIAKTTRTPHSGDIRNRSWDRQKVAFEVDVAESAADVEEALQDGYRLSPVPNLSGLIAHLVPSVLR